MTPDKDFEIAIENKSMMLELSLYQQSHRILITSLHCSTKATLCILSEQPRSRAFNGLSMARLADEF